MPTLTAETLDASSGAPARRGWAEFTGSTLGQLTAIVALLAVGLSTTHPLDALQRGERLGLLTLSLITIGCTAVLAYRDGPSDQR